MWVLNLSKMHRKLGISLVGCSEGSWGVVKGVLLPLERGNRLTRVKVRSESADNSNRKVGLR